MKPIQNRRGLRTHLELERTKRVVAIREKGNGLVHLQALPLPQVRYGLSVLLLEVYGTPGTDYICHQVYRQLLRNELARFYHHRTHKRMPSRKLLRDKQ
jgi:hypothetical protein